ncbi:MAG: DUF58 domain-containing protein [Planctomycetes bacterium]|nr:DUF58 domain-containing protein [Planctomycetota bacterium]NOG55830.1 DUF58 domain-containing protein [Planctomycetota bacterium]
MIPEELMRQVRRLQIATRRAVNEDFAGEYSSAFKGRGMEFAEVREYLPGDDVRAIDWNVTARTGSPYIKKYVEERELTVMFAVDLSASGQFGTCARLKNQTAAELCAVLAFAATRSNDKVGLLIFTDQEELYIPAAKGSRHVLRVIRELLNFEPMQRGTDIGAAVGMLTQVLKRRAVVFLVSDFMVPAMYPEGASSHSNRRGLVLDDHSQRMAGSNGRQPSLETALRLLNRRHDLIAVQVADERERLMPASGLIEFEDAETGERVTVDAGSSRVRHEFERMAHQTDRAIEEQFRRLGIDHLRVESGQSYVTALGRLFRQRERRR